MTKQIIYVPQESNKVQEILDVYDSFTAQTMYGVELEETTYEGLMAIIIGGECSKGKENMLETLKGKYGLKAMERIN